MLLFGSGHLLLFASFLFGFFSSLNFLTLSLRLFIDSHFLHTPLKLQLSIFLFSSHRCFLHLTHEFFLFPFPFGLLLPLRFPSLLLLDSLAFVLLNLAVSFLLLPFAFLFGYSAPFLLFLPFLFL
jgi:hypothetical protein